MFYDNSDDVVRIDQFRAKNDTWYVSWTMVEGTSDFTNGNSWMGEFVGIPLIPEWLERLGFENGNNQVFKLGKFTYNIHNGWWLGRKRLGKNFKYVHQIQNLVFAITGTELTY